MAQYTTMGGITVDFILSLTARSSLEFVALSRHLYTQLFGTQDNVISNKYVSVKFVGSDLLFKTNVYPITIKAELKDNEIEMESMKMLETYFSGFTLEKAIIKKIEKLPRLNHIYLSFPQEIYKILETKPKEYIHELFCKERESANDFAIVRMGDISHTLNGKVVHAEPCEQGFIDNDTIITIVQHESKESKEYKINPLRFHPLDNDEFVKFNVAPLNWETLEKYTQSFTTIPKSYFEDETLYAALPFNEFKKLGCFTGDVMRIKVNDCFIYIRVFPFNDPTSFVSHIYLSPLLILTLGNPTSIDITSAPKLIPHSNPKLSNYISLVHDVTVARVASPITLDKTLQNSFLANLKTYFESAHRVITKGQLIPIALDSTLAKTMNHTYGSNLTYPGLIPEGNPDSIAWFIVTGGVYRDKETGDLFPLESNCQYIVNSQKTKMLQSGVASIEMGDLDVYSLKKYLKIQPSFPFVNSTLPGDKCTFSYAKLLRKIYQTAIKTKGKVNLQTTVLLISSTRFVGKSTLVKTVSEEFGYSLAELDGFELLNEGGNSPAVVMGILRGKLDKLIGVCPNITILMKHIESICKKGDDQQFEQKSTDDLLSLQVTELMAEYTSKGAIFIATSNEPDNLNDILRSKMKFEIDISVPNEAERKEIFDYILKKVEENSRIKGKYAYLRGADVDIGALAQQSAALTPNDIKYVVDSVQMCALKRLKEEGKKLEISFDQLVDLNGGYIIMTAKDFENSINKARNKFSDSIGAPRIPNVKWEDVGGLDVVKNEILDTIEMPLKHPELFGSGMKKRSGLLFYGPPGTGKTLLAKAIATNFSLNFFSVKGPELLNMYIGESEANVRRVFEKARDAKPCVIFFDELDSVAPRRGNQGDSGGVMDRIVSQLLAELDGMSGSDGGDGVFVVGASNRPDLLDEALLRPGRFDKMLYLGISDTHDKQAKIIEALSRKFNLHPDIDLRKIAETCPFNFTGADFYALCSDAMLNAMIRTAGEVDQKLAEFNYGKDINAQLSLRQWFDREATDSDLSVVVGDEDFMKARGDLVASVSEEELGHYLRVRENFEGSKK